MRRADFDHVIRAAGAVLGEDTVIVIGSQALLASVDDPPPTALRSIEVDVLPVDGDEAKADLVDGSIGEASMFQEAFGVYAQGVGATTAVLADGWRDRLVPYETDTTGGVTALCLEPTDLLAAKLVAGRPKDLEFAAEVLRAGIVDLDGLHDRLGRLDVDADRVEALRTTAARLAAGGPTDS